MDHAQRNAKKLIVEEGKIWYLSNDYGKKILAEGPSTILWVI